MVRLPTGGFANYALMKGAHVPGMKPTPFDAAFSNLDYSGGPVMHSNTNYVVEWLPTGYTGTPFQDNSDGFGGTYSYDYVGGMQQFFTDLAHDSGGSANTDSVAAQYNDASGVAAYTSSYGGLLVDTNAFPASTCPANTGEICITDAQIQTELDSFLASQHKSADLAHEYFLITPPDVESCFDTTGTAGCSANQPTNPAYCAYHGRTAVGGYLYSNIPDLSGNGGCDPYGGFFYDHGPADGMLSAVSHEHTESITDPEPNNAWTDWQPGCTPTGPITCGGEIGDKCNGQTTYQPINGTSYLLQTEWSNQHTGGTGGGCVASWTSNGSTAHASFTATPGSANAMSFNASGSSATGGVAEYVWQFNDNTPANGIQNYTVETTTPTISHTFPAGGAYTVALTVMGSDGTSNGTAQNVNVGSSGGTAPTAAFTDSAPALEGTSVSFDGSGSSDPNPGGTLSYAWTFGDGATATAAKPSHSYSHFGSYTVTLKVTDSPSGLTNSVSHTVTITDEAPTAAFTFAPSAPTTATPVTFNGSGSSDSDGHIASYSWNFGDSHTGSGASPSHTYSSPGTYTVTLTVVDSDAGTATISHTITVSSTTPTAPTAAFTDSAPALEGTSVSFDGSGSSDPNPGGTLSYAWAFGDGATATAAKPSHSYSHFGSYTVTLTVTDSASSLTGSVSHTVTITDEGPTAAFTAPSGGIAGTAVAFHGSGSDPDGSISSYSWNFGDGQTGSGASPSHTYSSPGTYTVALTVFDSDAGTATISHTVAISPPPTPPTATFAASNGTESVPIAFNGSGSTDPNPGGSLTYAWSFGDGQTASGASVAHAFHAGGYTVRLTVTDSASGLSNTVSHAVSIADEAPSAAFTAPSGATAGTAVAFHGSATDPDGSISTYSWNFGDSQTGSGASPSHTYSSPGTRTVTLTVVDSDGQTASVSQPVTIKPAPIQCVVPSLKGDTLGRAKSLLATAHCSLAKTHAPKKPKHAAGKHKHWALVVTKQGTPAGRTEPKGFAVNVTLMWKARQN